MASLDLARRGARLLPQPAWRPPGSTSPALQLLPPPRRSPSASPCGGTTDARARRLGEGDEAMGLQLLEEDRGGARRDRPATDWSLYKGRHIGSK